MPLIVDAYNVLHVVGVLPPDLAGIDVGGLVELIQRSRFAREKVQLVCDGAPSTSAGRLGRAGISVRHSGAGRSADSVIIAAIKASTAPRRLTVVSSDREIRRAARKRRCVVMTSEAFLKRLALDVLRARAAEHASPGRRAARVSGSLRPAEVQRWIGAFGVTESDLQRLQAEADSEAAARSPSPAPSAPATSAAPRSGPARKEPKRSKRRDGALEQSLLEAIAEAQAMVDSHRSTPAQPDRAAIEPAAQAKPAPRRRPVAPSQRGLRQLGPDHLREMFEEARRLADEVQPD